MKSAFLKGLVCAAGMSVMVFLCPHVHAQPLTPEPAVPGIAPPGQSDVLQINLTSGLGFEVSESDAEEAGVNVIIVPTVGGSPIPANPAMFGSPAVMLDGDGSISDVIGEVQDASAQGGLAIAFWSDDDSNPTTVIPSAFLGAGGTPSFLTETSAALNASFFIIDAPATALGPVQTLIFSSDVDAPDGGMTWALMSIGLAALACLRRTTLAAARA